LISKKHLGARRWSSGELGTYSQEPSEEQVAKNSSSLDIDEIYNLRPSSSRNNHNSRLSGPKMAVFEALD
jgi:hypothetical protein